MKNKILFFGEPLIRITPVNYGTLGDMVQAELFYGGSEINVARTLQGFGVPTKLITGLPEHPVGTRFLDYLKQTGMDVSCVQRSGERVGLYYLEQGFGKKSTQVYYDRGHTSICDMQIDQINFDQLFEDVGWFHFSGITVAISATVREVLDHLLQEAKNRQITISMDLNLRTRMITITEAKQRFSRYVSDVDYCFGIEPLLLAEDDYDMFDREHASFFEIEERMRGLKDKYQLKGIFHTDRQTTAEGLNCLKAYGLMDELYCSEVMKTPVLERIGSGDAFVAGVLYGLGHDWSLAQTTDFGVACATYKCCVRGDSMYEPLDQVLKMLHGQAGLQR